VGGSVAHPGGDFHSDEGSEKQNQLNAFRETLEQQSKLPFVCLISLSPIVHLAIATARNHLYMKRALFTLLPLVMASVPPAAMAQREIPKAPGHDQCPLGYVNTLGTTCFSPIHYEVAPTYGEACKSGWMNIGAGYCKKKTLGIF